DEQRPVAHGGRLVERAGDPDAPLREAAEHVDDEKRKAADVIRRAEAPAGDQPQGAQRERRTVAHGLYLGYPWAVRLPPACVKLPMHRRLPASCPPGGPAPRVTSRGDAPEI